MDIPFESVADLVHRLGHPPKSTKYRADGSAIPLAPDKIFLSWLAHLPRPFPNGTGKRLFRLLFPHEGARRRYGLKEIRLARELEGILDIDGLSHWDAVSSVGAGGRGCLGDMVEASMKARLPPETRSRITLAEVDTLLDTLAAPSQWSQLSQAPANQPDPSTILRRLFRDSGLSPFALSFLIQVILRDLRPIFAPLPRMSKRHPTLMLRCKITSAPAQLGLHLAMWAWDPTMARLYRDGKGCIDWVADAAEAVARGSTMVPVPSGPVVGVNVQIPKCSKGRSINDALKVFMDPSSGCGKVWAETKYDGYRMQIHVELGPDPRVTIFSKSKRNSTKDRTNTHALVLAALGLPIPQKLPSHCALATRAAAARPPRRRVRQSVILEAEVVPFNEGARQGGRGPGIEEFWWLQAAGVTTGSFDVPAYPPLSNPPSLFTGHTTRYSLAVTVADYKRTSISHSESKPDRHLCLVFFDVLHVDGESLIGCGYDARRKVLESLVRPLSGFALLAERTEIPVHMGARFAQQALRDVFDRSSDCREEGLVLKAAHSAYSDTRLHWVKLKKDYIPGLGDTVDLVVVGAGWDIDRARELRVDNSVYTTFYVGTLANGEAVTSHRQAPRFEILFRASYGLSRDQLESINDSLRLRKWTTRPFDRDDPWKRRLLGLSWHYNLPQGMPPPSVLFDHPMCAEVMGAGFQRLPFSELYELRWPRLLKIYEKAERSWTAALTAPKLIAVAHAALGYKAIPSRSTPTTPPSPEDDSMRAMWRAHSTTIVGLAPRPIPSPAMKRTMTTPHLGMSHHPSGQPPLSATPWLPATPTRPSRSPITTFPRPVLRLNLTKSPKTPSPKARCGKGPPLGPLPLMSPLTFQGAFVSARTILDRGEGAGENAQGGVQPRLFAARNSPRKRARRGTGPPSPAEPPALLFSATRSHRTSAILGPAFKDPSEVEKRRRVGLPVPPSRSNQTHAGPKKFIELASEKEDMMILDPIESPGNESLLGLSNPPSALKFTTESNRGLGTPVTSPVGPLDLTVEDDTSVTAKRRRLTIGSAVAVAIIDAGMPTPPTSSPRRDVGSSLRRSGSARKRPLSMRSRLRLAKRRVSMPV